MNVLKRIPACAGSHPWTIAAIVLGAASGAALKPLDVVDSLPRALLIGAALALPGLLRFAYLLGTTAPATASAGLMRRLRAWIVGHTPAPSSKQIDPLRNRVAAAVVAGLVGVTAVVALAVSIHDGAPAKLPPIALSSPALFHVQRMLVPTLAVALLSVFLVRAAFGYFPVKVSTSGAEWASAAVAAGAQTDIAATDAATVLTGVVDGLTTAQRRIDDEQREHTVTLNNLRAAAQQQRRFMLALQSALTSAAPTSAQAFDEAWEALESESSSG